MAVEGSGLRRARRRRTAGLGARLPHLLLESLDAPLQQVRVGHRLRHQPHPLEHLGLGRLGPLLHGEGEGGYTTQNGWT